MQWVKQIKIKKKTLATEWLQLRRPSAIYKRLCMPRTKQLISHCYIRTLLDSITTIIRRLFSQMQQTNTCIPTEATYVLWQEHSRDTLPWITVANKFILEKNMLHLKRQQSWVIIRQLWNCFNTDIIIVSTITLKYLTYLSYFIFKIKKKFL